LIDEERTNDLFFRHCFLYSSFDDTKEEDGSKFASVVRDWGGGMVTFVFLVTRVISDPTFFGSLYNKEGLFFATLRSLSNLSFFLSALFYSSTLLFYNFYFS